MLRSSSVGSEMSVAMPRSEACARELLELFDQTMTVQEVTDRVAYGACALVVIPVQCSKVEREVS